MSLAWFVLSDTSKKALRAAGSGVATGSKGKNSHLLRYLISLGGLGLFGVSIVDSSVIPLPLPGSSDLLLLLLTSHRGSTVQTAVWLWFCTFAGSMIGGYLTWSAGRKGGEVTLERYVPKKILGRVTGWVEGHGGLAIGVAALLPPPVPLTPFLLAAGALKVPRTPFLLYYGTARALRYGLLAWLGVTYGRHFVRLWQKQLDKWSGPILWTYGGLVALGIVYGVWKFMRGRRSDAPVQRTAEDVA